MTGMTRKLRSAGTKKILQITHVPVGVGFAQTKTLAKLANHAAKTWTKTGGVVDLSVPLRQKRLMALLPVNEVWGVGRKISNRLNAMGIFTALDLANAETTMIRKTFGVVVERTVRELNGESCIELEEIAKTKEQIICSRSFGKKLSSMNICIRLFVSIQKEQQRNFELKNNSVLLSLFLSRPVITEVDLNTTTTIQNV